MQRLDSQSKIMRQRKYTTVTAPAIVHAGKDFKGTCKCAEEELVAAFCKPAEECYFHKMFYECAECKVRPAQRLCTTTWKGLCFKHSQAHPHRLFICYDLSRFDRMLFCGKCQGFATVECIEPVLEQLFTTKGTFVDEAILDKDISTLESTSFGVVAATMQGWRANNEDAYCVHMNLNHISVFGVFDGHGGDRVAHFVASKFAGIFTSIMKSTTDMVECLTKTFIAIDDAIAAENDLEDISGGCGTTACVVAINATTIYCANAGDARAILCRSGGVVPLSTDHKPTMPAEKARIEAAGGRVSPDGRVDDVLAVARAFGDLDFKQAAQLPPEKQAVTCVPDVTVTTRVAGMDEFLVIACDGVWDCKSSEEVMVFLRNGKKQMKDTVASLLDACVCPTLHESGIGTDNMSILTVTFKYEDWTDSWHTASPRNADR